MSEVEYKICRIIAVFKNTLGINPDAKVIAKLIYYSVPTTNYHLKKLERKGIVKKDRKKRYELLVDNLK